MNKKIVDIDIDPFGEHDTRPEEPTGENIPLTPVGGGTTWESEHEQETSFRGESQRLKLKKEVKDLNSRKNMLKHCIESYQKTWVKP